VLERLDYRAPGLVAKAVGARYPGAKNDLLVMDAGCGTGLCGPLLRPFASSLVGVDLSPKMLDKAKGRQVYDELVTAELVGYLEQQPASFNLIVSADTLCYFGDLSPFLKAAKGALLPGGHLIFTVEKGETETGFALNIHGRYSHARKYIEDELKLSGFQLCSIEHEKLRKEAGEPVWGLLVTAMAQEKP